MTPPPGKNRVKEMMKCGWNRDICGYTCILYLKSIYPRLKMQKISFQCYKFYYISFLTICKFRKVTKAAAITL